MEEFNKYRNQLDALADKPTYASESAEAFWAGTPVAAGLSLYSLLKNNGS